MEQTVQISDLQIGDIILVKAGEKIPVDGKVVAGSGSVNQASITGESVPVPQSRHLCALVISCGRCAPAPEFPCGG